jgi:hypothetical protein
LYFLPIPPPFSAVFSLAKNGREISEHFADHLSLSSKDRTNGGGGAELEAVLPTLRRNFPASLAEKSAAEEKLSPLVILILKKALVL